MRALCLVLLVAPLAACELIGPGAVRSAPPPDDAVTLREGAAARIDSLGAVLRFERLLAESRCPEDAVCAWEGEAVVRITWAPDDGPAFPVALTLRGAGTAPTPKDTLGYTFTLLQVEPYPRVKAPRPVGTPTASFRIARAQ